MKILFLVFYGFQEYNGISKKIGYQADALRQCGADVRVCRYEVAGDGSRKWMTLPSGSSSRRTPLPWANDSHYQGSFGTYTL